jgi:hypothetical protein
MSVDVRWVRYGRPAAEALRAAISGAKGDEPLEPVTVVVPSNYVGVATRRLLASGTLGPMSTRGTGVAAVSFVTVYRLAELLGSPGLIGAGRRPVSTPVIAAALRATLAEAPGIFKPVAGHAATESSLVAAYRELRDLSDGALESLASRSDRASDVVRLHRMARQSLESSFYDEGDLLDAATAFVRKGGGPGHLGGVVVYLPEMLTRHGGALLGAIADAGALMVLAGTTGASSADREVIRSVGRIDPTAERSHPGDDLPLRVVGAEWTQIVTVSDCDEEVRVAVRSVIDAARKGTPLDRMAILHASPHPYARLAHEQLSAAGIALNGDTPVSLTSRLVSRTLLGLLALPEGGWRREDVFAWLAGGPLHYDGRSAPVLAWERLSREAGVVAGRTDWDQRLANLSAGRVTEAERIRDEDPDAPPWMSERLLQDEARARALREFVLGLIDEVTQAADQLHPWGTRAEWARGLLDRLLGGERRRAPWPLPERKAAERVDRALDRLACLDALESAVSLPVFARSLELELEADLGRVGRMGEGVLVGSVGMGVGLDMDLVVVLGLAEGTFPSPTRDDSLLPDQERESTGGELPLRSQEVDRQHRQLLAALAGASRQVLCVPRGDLRRNVERVPSRWILQMASSLDGERWWSDDLLNARRDWLSHVASFDAGMRTLNFPANEQEHRLRTLMAQGASRLPLSVLAADALLGGGAEVVAARRSGQFTRFDANLHDLPVPSPADEIMSATRLEEWAACPFAYFVHNVLKVGEIENPEDELQITPRDKGSLVHGILERFVLEMIERPDDMWADRHTPWSASDRTRLMQIGEEECQRYEAAGRTGRPIFWRQSKKRIMVDLHKFLDQDSRYRLAHATQPLAAELGFGLGGSALGTVALELPDGRQVRFRGKADRVDRAPDGTLHVIDYKTGKSDGFKDLNEDNPDAQGRHLQLAVYGQAARLSQGTPEADVWAEYWFISSVGRFARIGYPITPSLLAHVGETLGAMVQGIEAGVFPHYPTEKTNVPWIECAFCDPDGLGVAELRRQYRHKQADAAMAPFVEFVDPLEGDAGDSEMGIVKDA